jgi:hypothetical protein
MIKSKKGPPPCGTNRTMQKIHKLIFEGFILSDVTPHREELSVLLIAVVQRRFHPIVIEVEPSLRQADALTTELHHTP